MESNRTRELELNDVKRVEAILKGNLNTAAKLLPDAIGNTPEEYSNFEDHGDRLSIEFRDGSCYVHYVTCNLSQGVAMKKIDWIGNA